MPVAGLTQVRCTCEVTDDDHCTSLPAGRCVRLAHSSGDAPPAGGDSVTLSNSPSQGRQSLRVKLTSTENAQAQNRSPDGAAVTSVFAVVAEGPSGHVLVRHSGPGSGHWELKNPCFRPTGSQGACALAYPLLQVRPCCPHAWTREDLVRPGGRTTQS